jgi:hypothetical protein
MTEGGYSKKFAFGFVMIILIITSFTVKVCLTVDFRPPCVKDRVYEERCSDDYLSGGKPKDVAGYNSCCHNSVRHKAFKRYNSTFNNND